MILDLIEGQLYGESRARLPLAAMAKPSDASNEPVPAKDEAEAAKCPVDHKTRELWLAQAREAAQQKREQAGRLAKTSPSMYLPSEARRR